MGQHVRITLADNKERSLRYTLAAVRRIKQKFAGQFPPKSGDAANQTFVQHPVMQALAASAEDVIPYLLMEGIVEKEGLTEQVIADELIDGPMLDDLALKVIEAFFGPRQAALLQNVRALQEVAIKSAVDKAVAALTPTPVPSGQIVN